MKIDAVGLGHHCKHFSDRMFLVHYQIIIIEAVILEKLIFKRKILLCHSFKLLYQS